MAAVAALAVCWPGAASAATAGGPWTIQSLALPAGATGEGIMLAVSCPSAADCTAVGIFARTHGRWLAEHWNGSTWAIRGGIRLPADFGQELSVHGVSCTSAASCTTVGYYSDKSGQTVTLAEYWDGSTWTVQSTPPGGGALDAVSCTSPASCTAVGDDENGSPLAEHWDGSTWTIQATPSPPGVPGVSVDQLTGVSCTSPASCTATGGSFNNDGGADLPLVEYWDGSTWTIQATPLPAGHGDGGLTGVSCTAAASCTATGYSSVTLGGPPASPLAEYWNGSTWTVQATPPGNGALDAVSCTSAASCTATGSSGRSAGTDMALAEHWNGSTWERQQTAQPAAGLNLHAVSCTRPRTCTAVGTIASPTLVTEPLAEHE